MLSLYNHQQKIINDDPQKTLLALSCGSGKTRISLALARGKTLVVCPKTQRDDKNWERELEAMGIELDLTVISKEDFRRDHKELPPCDTFIGDEIHTMLGVTPSIHWKNKVARPKASQLFWALRWYVKEHNPERLYLVTATIVKSPMTVWGAGVLLGTIKADMGSFYAFRDEFYIRLPIPRREVYAPKADKTCKTKLAQIVHNMGYVGQLSDYFDVPDQNYKNEYIELTKGQKDNLKDIHLDYPEPIVQIGKRLQIENGILNGDEYNEGIEIKDNKVDRIVEYSYEFPKMIVVAKYTMQIEKIKRELKGKNVYLLTGKTKDRGELLDKLKKEDEYVLIVQAQVTAGWELPLCPVIIFASRTYSFVDYVQAQGRILRANALKKNLYINLVVKGGVDEAVHKALLNKCDFDEKLYENN